ncbi:alanine--tRNA ligase [Methanothrix thermoacetophila]|uniref:Alanine--tRNA ligase n=2 Tax=Methanothrix TaxID=2222 RepID=SYA_METTP|nr:alanine--tRNA ligase [Methanothrix thermoacetophila]A0B6X3.1 RecName: Full=Alanine--tRNA ligase; AltName: Full=Alanyl-tRNA synthetase; Short=AlaRS [Methanothrix thermoacetophila PT]ABK14447.1 alanyl-tRNA synthetase [Methanothrix thermoacetophila PT]
MFPEDEYQLEFFRTEGFVRKVCESCGGSFWTRDASRRTCGDPPCDPYSFIGSPVFREMELDSMREHYLSFFEAHGHTRVQRYPVVARWRDDIYLTIASIADFQPFVTSGQVPPPANPLTISQPCIRLDDLDSVGRSGRHLTTFEMMAHHVFNTKEHEIYWKDRTVELCDELLLGLGVDPESITYKESPWAGGGNAGPSLEVLVGGLELATLVFMNLRLDSSGEYVIKGERYSRMDNYIVDTGYGLERFVWASKGSPTIYDAVFPDIVRELSDLAGVEHDLHDPEYAEIFARNARLAGMIDLGEASLRDLRKRIAESINTTPERLERIMAPMERIYAIADHTRCLAYMLGDGIIPSNVKAGYLARLVIRRTLRMMKDLKLEIPLSEIVEMQISKLDYDDWRERMETISEILSLEEERYAETLEKGSRMVSKIASHYSKKGGRIPLTELVSLYDTHGIPPEIARETAGALGVDVELPDNFYSIVASTHSRAEQREVETRSPPFEKTERLFYYRPFDQEFDATVLGIFEGSVVLDRTLFYPEGGGQPADRGVLVRDGQVFNVNDVQMIDGVVLHRVEQEGLSPGDRVTGRIDMRRRMAHARHHTATHIVNDSAKRVLGRHVWQAGAQKSEDRARLDISHYRRISDEELKAIELEANRRVMEMIPVITEFMPREEAERLFGFQLYQGGVPPGREIRVVRVGSDIEACAGTHVTNTGMIGPIKILRTERVQDGVERIEFAAGEAAVQRIQERDDILAEAASILRVPIEQLPRTVFRFFEEWKDQQKVIEHLKEEIAGIRILTLSSEAVDVNGVSIVARDMGESDGETLLKAATMLSERDITAILGGASGGAAKIVVSVGRSGLERGLNAADIVRAAAKYIGGGGGGKPDLAQGGGPNVGGLRAAIDAGMSAARKALQV